MSMIVQTYTGKLIDLMDPRIHQISIHDIAHSLSMQCRYGGHTHCFYSVAEHSILGSHEFDDKREALAFLMHDAAEAYLTDLPSPIKKHHPEFIEVEKRLLDVIWERFSLPDDVDMAKIYAMDLAMLAMEKRKVLLHDREWNMDLPEPAKTDPIFMLPNASAPLFMKLFREMSNVL